MRNADALRQASNPFLSGIFPGAGSRPFWGHRKPPGDQAMKNQTKPGNSPGGIHTGLPFIGPALALVSMLIVAAIAAPVVMMMM